MVKSKPKKPNPYLQDGIAPPAAVRPAAGKVPPVQPTAQPQKPTPVFDRLCDVQAVPVQWLWPGRIALGRITLLAGRPKVGKSFVTMDIAARVTRGLDWPDGTPCPAGEVLLLSAEDGVADTIRPRLDAAGADTSKVVAMRAVRHGTDADGKPLERVVTLADLNAIRSMLDQMPDCRLLVIDPIGSYLGGTVDSYRDNEVRAVLTPLAQLAEDRGLAALVVAHVKKGGAAYADDAVLGSTAFIGIARGAIHVMADPDDPKKRRRFLLGGGTNLAVSPTGLAFEVCGDPPSVGWAGAVDLTADDIASGGGTPGRPPAKRTDCEGFIRDVLAGGPLPADECERRAEQAGFTRATVVRAKKSLGVIAGKVGFQGRWVWRLPDPSSGTPGDVDLPDWPGLR